MFSIKLAEPVTSVRVQSDNQSASAVLPQNDAPRDTSGRPDNNETRAATDAQRVKLIEDLENQKAKVARICETLNTVLGKLNQFHDELLATHKEEIAKLSVEIARKVVMQKVQSGDYQIESIVQEALKRAPVHQDIVVHLHPDDLTQCQKVLDSQPGALGADAAGIKFVPDSHIGRAECVLETPKGIVKSLLSEHLKQIDEALRNAK
jgi:flagellar biosynthesis/type III secretory pathway protein FliH